MKTIRNNNKIKKLEKVLHKFIRIMKIKKQIINIKRRRKKRIELELIFT